MNDSHGPETPFRGDCTILPGKGFPGYSLAWSGVEASASRYWATRKEIEVSTPFPPTPWRVIVPHPMLVGVGLLGVLFCASAASCLEVDGQILSDTTWDATTDPVVVTSDISIPEGVTLTVTEGVRVRVRGDSSFHVNGSLNIQGDSGQPASFLPETAGDEWGSVVVSGLRAGIKMRCANVRGGQLKILNGAACSIEDCSLENIRNRVGLQVERGSPAEIRRTVFAGVFQPIHSLRTRLLVEDCSFTDMQGDAVVVDFPDDDILPPHSIRMTAPSRTIAGKTTSLRVEVLDRKGDLYWPMWTGRGTVSAVSPDTGATVPLSSHEIDFTNGIGSLTTSLGLPGEIDLTVAIEGLSVSKRVTVLPAATSGTILSATLSNDWLDWGPEDGVIHLQGSSIVQENDTLTIRPGTLVMMDEKARLRVDGRVSALGTQEAPVSFFSVHDAKPWASIEHRNPATTSVFENVFFAGGGDTPIVGHASGHAVHAASGKIEARDCSFLDLAGKGIEGRNADLFLSRCLFSRCPMGAELGGEALRVEDCYFLDIDSGGDDQDGLYLWLPPPDCQVRRCIVAKNGDDGIDTLGGCLKLTDSIVYGSSDKNVSLTNTEGEIDNCLFFDARLGVSPKGIGKVDLLLSQCTVSDHSEAGYLNLNKFHPTGATSGLRATIENSILWGNPLSVHTDFDPRNATLDHCNLNPPPQDFPEIDNIYSDPMFVDPARMDYRLRTDSPALVASSEGQQVGWLGYPSRETAPPALPSVIRGSEFRRGQGRGVVFTHNADGWVENCEFSNLGEAGLHLNKKSTGEIARCVVERCATGISIESSASASLAHVTIVGCTDTGIHIGGDLNDWSGGSVVLHSGILWKNEIGVLMEQGAEISVDRSNIGPSDGSVFPGEGNVSSDPLFVDENQSDYRLQGYSPSVSTGRGGTDMGAYQRPVFEGGSGWAIK